MIATRVKEIAAMAMIGEGVLGLVNPRGHLHLWNFGPEVYRELVNGMEAHPDLMRALFAAEVGVGLWWALRQTGCPETTESLAGSPTESENQPLAAA